MPPRWLIILDLNGTLLHRLTRSHEISAARQTGVQPHCTVHQNPIYLRPGLKDFLLGLQSMEGVVVEVAIWTSAQMKNALPMTLHAFQGLLDIPHLLELSDDIKQTYLNFPPWQLGGGLRLKFLWAQAECLKTPNPAGGYKPLFIKDLSRVFTRFPEYSANNTLIIDDTPEKLADWPRNHLVIKPYLYNVHDDVTELQRVLDCIQDRVTNKG